MPRDITTTVTVYTFAELKALGDKKAIEKALDWLREGATDHDWWEYQIKEWKKALASVGFEDADIRFSGFWSQGDGASFTADINLDVLVGTLANPPAAKERLDLLPGSTEEYDWPPWVMHKVGGVRSDPKFAKLLRIRDSVEFEMKRTMHQYHHPHTCRISATFNDGGEYVDGPLKSGVPTRVWKTRQPRLTAVYDRFYAAAEQFRVDLCRAIYKDLQSEYEYLTSDEVLAETAEANEYTFDANGKREG